MSRDADNFDIAQWHQSPTGAQLCWRSSSPAKHPKAAILICHGFGGQSDQYRAFCRFLAKQGFCCFAFDQRGHGLTTASDSILGQFANTNGVMKVLEDVKAMHSLIEKKYPGLPVILVGHDMGATIALNATIEYPAEFSGICLCNSAFHLGPARNLALFILTLERFFKGSDVPSIAMHKIMAPKSQHQSNKPLHDRSKIDTSLARMPYENLATVSLWRDLLNLTKRPFANDRLKRLPPCLPFCLAGEHNDASAPLKNHNQTLWIEKNLTQRGFHHVTRTLYFSPFKEPQNMSAMHDFANWCMSHA